MSRKLAQYSGLGFTSIPTPARKPEPSFSSDGVYTNGCYYWNDGTVDCDPRPDDKSLAAKLGLTPTALTLLGIVGVIALLVLINPKKGN